MATRILFFSFFFFSFYTPAFAQNTLAEGPFKQLILRGVTLINGNGAPARGPVDIVIEGDKITDVKVVGNPGITIDPNNRPQLKKGGKEIDGTGKYALPGFVDMHGHIGGVSQGADWDYVFHLWLAHGVTTVREPSGRGIDFTLDLKKKRPTMKLLLPELFPTPDLVKESMA